MFSCIRLRGTLQIGGAPPAAAPLLAGLAANRVGQVDVGHGAPLTGQQQRDSILDEGRGVDCGYFPEKRTAIVCSRPHELSGGVGKGYFSGTRKRASAAHGYKSLPVCSPLIIMAVA